MITVQPATLEHHIAGYQLCATTEGKSPNSVAIVTSSANYFHHFLTSQGIAADMTEVTHHEIRAFILHLQHKRCFSDHRFNHAQDKGLSGHTINCYLRSLRIFFSWLVSEGIIDGTPFFAGFGEIGHSGRARPHTPKTILNLLGCIYILVFSSADWNS